MLISLNFRSCGWGMFMVCSTNVKTQHGMVQKQMEALRAPPSNVDLVCQAIRLFQ
jgi:hypothetical protein